MSWNDVKELRWKDLKRMARRMDREDLLNRFGLTEHTPTSDFFTGLGLFAVGVLVGAGLGLLFAPKPGVEMRSRLGETIRRRGERLAEEAGQRFGVEPAPQAPGSRIG